MSSLPWALGHLQSGEVSSVIKKSDWNKSFKSYSLLVSDKIKETAIFLQTNKISLDVENFKDLIFSLTKLSGWANAEFEALAYCFIDEKWETFKNSSPENTPKQISDLSEETNENEETKILNSFYVNDLQAVKNAFAQDDCGAAIKAFLSENEITDANKFNLDNQENLESILAPQNIPLGRWASDDEKYQSLMQQAAINLALTKTKQNGKLFSVN